MHALDRICHRAFLTVGKARYAGQVLIPSCSLRYIRLSHSETVCNTVWAGPTGLTHRTPRGACLCQRSRGLGPPSPRVA